MSLTAWVSVLTVAIAGAGVTIALFNYLAANFRDLGGAITKTDDKIDETRSDLISRIDATRSELNAKIDDTRSELKADIADVRAGVSVLEGRVYELALRGEPRAH